MLVFAIGSFSRLYIFQRLWHRPFDLLVKVDGGVAGGVPGELGG